jgi:hypothetical protein
VLPAHWRPASLQLQTKHCGYILLEMVPLDAADAERPNAGMRRVVVCRLSPSYPASEGHSNTTPLGEAEILSTLSRIILNKENHVSPHRHRDRLSPGNVCLTLSEGAKERIRLDPFSHRKPRLTFQSVEKQSPSDSPRTDTPFASTISPARRM